MARLENTPSYEHVVPNNCLRSYFYYIPGRLKIQLKVILFSLCLNVIKMCHLPRGLGTLCHLILCGFLRRGGPQFWWGCHE